MKIKTTAGITNKKIRVRISDSTSTTNAGLTGLLFNSAGLVAYYYREGDTSATVITLVTATLGTWVSGGFQEVDATHMPGVYEIGLPNTALAVAGTTQIVIRGATNMVDCPIEVELDAVNYQDAIRFGLTALPNAVASAAGGLPTFGTGTGQVNPSGGKVPATIGATDYTGNTAQTGDSFAVVNSGIFGNSVLHTTEAAIKEKTDLIGTNNGDSSNATEAQGVIAATLDAAISSRSAPGTAQTITFPNVAGLPVDKAFRVLIALCGGKTVVGESSVDFLDTDGTTPVITITYGDGAGARASAVIH